MIFQYEVMLWAALLIGAFIGGAAALTFIGSGTMERVKWQPMFTMRQPKDLHAYLLTGEHGHATYPEVAVWDAKEGCWMGTLNGELHTQLGPEYARQWLFYVDLGPLPRPGLRRRDE